MEKSEVVTKSHSVTKSLILVMIFFTGTAIALAVYSKISLPFSNPWAIKGPLTAFKYNPNNDILRFLMFVGLPSALLLVIGQNRTIGRFIAPLRGTDELADDPGQSGSFMKVLVYVGVVGALVLVAGHTYRSFPLDTFHEGETLGPAVDYLNGKVPYRDTIFIHGVFRDPLRAVLAFKLFGRSIGALRTLDALLSILGKGVFFLAVYILYSRSIYHTALFVIPVLIVNEIRPYGLSLPITYVDIPFFLLLIVAAKIYAVIKSRSLKRSRIKVAILLGLFTFIPTVCFAVSLDKGFFLCTAASLYALLLYFVFLRQEKNRYKFPLIGGYVLGIIGVGLSIKWALSDFVKYVSVLLRYEGLMNGFIYPFTDFRFLAPVLLICLNLYWLTLRGMELRQARAGSFGEKLKQFFTKFFMEGFLLLVSLSYFQRVLGRSDTGHLADSLLPVVMLTGYVAIQHYVKPSLKRSVNLHRLLPGAGICALALFFIVALPRVNWAAWYKFPIRIPDAQFIPDNYLEAISYLRQNLNSNDDFLTLTSEGSWYYFINKPCPIKFSAIYQAMPYFYQDEIVESLRKANVKYVLYKNDHWANDIEGFDVAERLPRVIEYIDDHYIFHKKIDDQEIWIKKRARL